MKHPLRLIIHVPLREERDFRTVLVGLKHALCVSIDGRVCTYDLLPSFKPRKGQEHLILEDLALQLDRGWAIAVWNVDMLLSGLEEIMKLVAAKPGVALKAKAAWATINAADEEQLLDLRSFAKFPNGHYLSIVAARESFRYDRYPASIRRKLLSRRPSRPRSEDLWGVLHPLIMTKSEATRAWDAYRRWVANNRPAPPRHDVEVSNER